MFRDSKVCEKPFPPKWLRQQGGLTEVGLKILESYFTFLSPYKLLAAPKRIKERETLVCGPGDETVQCCDVTCKFLDFLPSPSVLHIEESLNLFRISLNSSLAHHEAQKLVSLHRGCAFSGVQHHIH